MINRIPMSLFLNSKGKSIKGIAHNQYTSRSKMKGRIVSFIGIFLMISLKMMGGAEGKPQPQPQPEPQPEPEPLPQYTTPKPPCGYWCRTPKYNYNCRYKGKSVCDESSLAGLG